MELSTSVSISGPAPKRGVGRQYFYWARLAPIILLAALVACKRQSATPAGGGRGGGMGPTTISTATASQGSIGVYVNALGVVTPLKTVSINSRVQGQILAVKYQEGQMVHAGDPMIEIDPGPSQASLTQVEGQLMRDSAILKDAKLDLERYQEAYASNAIPKQQLDTQVATVEQDEGTVKVDQGSLDNAKVQLGYCHITAPISGRVGLRLVDEGNMAQANSTTALAVITQLQPITVIFNVAEDDLPQVLEQLHAGKTLTVDAFDRAQTRKLASGTLETLDNQIDPSTGTVKFRAIFTNEDESLFPNQFVNARLLVRTQEGVTLLPNAVIQRNSEGAFVYVVSRDQNSSEPANPTGSGAADTNSDAAANNPPNHPESNTGDTNSMKAGGARNYPSGTVSMKTITAGTTDGNVTAVEGIDPGTVVAADSFNKLTDGAKVLIRPSAAGGASGGAGGKGGYHKKPQSQPDNPQPQPEQ